MLVNSDFSRRAVVAPDQYKWVASPQVGVDRVMLDRVGGEKARATSIVRYAPASHFPMHEHPGGEEILVLSGTFSEGQEHYPAGWYMRNPPGSSHCPHSEEGAVIFVKLWQMPPSETRSVRVDARDPSRWQRTGDRDVCPLFSHGAERVCLERLAAGTPLFQHPVDSAEVLVLAGEIHLDGQRCAQGSWFRLPAGDHASVVAAESGATVFLKTGHLADPAVRHE